MATWEPNDGEKVLMEEPAGYLKSKVNMKPGRLVLTDRRLVFLKQPPYAALFGVIGALIARKSRGGKVLFDLDRAAIRGVARGKHGRNDNVLEIRTAAEELRFLPKSPFDAWAGALQGLTSDRAAGSAATA